MVMRGIALIVNKQTVPLREDADGRMRVGETRVPLETVVGSFKDGAVPEEIVLAYPTLTLTEVYQVVAFYLANQREVETYLEERERLAEQVQRKVESRFSKAGLRERLLARVSHER